MSKHKDYISVAQEVISAEGGTFELVNRGGKHKMLKWSVRDRRNVERTGKAFLSGSPSEYRGLMNFKTQLRRAIREAVATA